VNLHRRGHEAPALGLTIALWTLLGLVMLISGCTYHITTLVAGEGCYALRDAAGAGEGNGSGGSLVGHGASRVGCGEHPADQ